MKSKLVFGMILLSLAACKSTGSGSHSEVMSAPDSCGDALTLDKVSGEKVYQLTEQCVFNDKVHVVKLRILSETYKKVLDDGCSATDSGFGHVIALNIDGKDIENVGIKVRGNTSRCNSKRQFKFKFDETEMYSQINGNVSKVVVNQNKGRKFFGLETISVRASANDPAMIREEVASDGFRAANDSAPTTLRGPAVYRLAPAKFYVSFNRSQNEGPEGNFKNLMNGYYYDYMGYYSLAENIDRVFIDSRFQKGNDIVSGYHLVAADIAKASLERSSYDRKGWAFEFVDGAKIKSKDQEAKLEQELFKLMDLLKTETLDAGLSKSIDIDSVVNYTAGAIFNGHWDSLLSNANNDSLYFNGATQKWQIFAWDLDNTLGANRSLYKSLMSDDIFAAAREHPNRLITTVFAPNRPAFRKRLMERLESLAKGYYSEEQFNLKINHLAELLRSNTENWETPKDGEFEAMKAFVNQRRSVIQGQITN
jgi:hypothetical protein